MKQSSPRGDGRPRPSNRAKPGSALATISKIFALFCAALREIFDESGYERFLAQHHLTSSAAAYSSFCREHDHRRARHARCC